MNPLSAPRVALVGFGEAGEAFVRAPGWRGEACAWDVLPERRAAIRELGVETGETAGDAIADHAFLLSLVTADQPTALATIQTLDPIYVDITQSSAELLNLKLAMQGGHLTRNGPADARVMLDLTHGVKYPIPGTQQFSEVTVDPATGNVTLRAIFPNPNGDLLPGMFVRATIIEGVQPNGILAPQRGISRNEKGDPTALIVDDKGIVRLRALKTGQAIGDNWLVTSGLKAGDRLIVEGLQKVQPDMPAHAVAFKQAAVKPGGN